MDVIEAPGPEPLVAFAGTSVPVIVPALFRVYDDDDSVSGV